MVKSITANWGVKPNPEQTRRQTKVTTTSIFPTSNQTYGNWLYVGKTPTDSVQVPYQHKPSAPADSVSQFNLVNLDSKNKADVYGVMNGTLRGDAVEMYGIKHYKYKQCAPEDLVDIGNGKKLHRKCYEAFKKMQKAAKAENITLIIVQAYRTVDDQKRLFKNKFKNKQHPTSAELKGRLKYAAPPGYSEHHTGLAVDINTTTSPFGSTKAYQWMKKHAKEFGFEQSFPENNKQNLGCEPWHWRYVGDEECAENFTNARENR